MRLILRGPIFIAFAAVQLLALSLGLGAQPTAGPSSPISSAPAASALTPAIAIQREPDRAPTAPVVPITASGAAPPAAILRLDSPMADHQEPPSSVTGERSDPSVRAEMPSANAPTESPRKLPAVVERLVATLVYMDGVTLFGLVSLVAMLVFYSLEDRSPSFIFAFATACWMSSAYAFLRWPWPFGIVGATWGVVALRKWWRSIKSKNRGFGNGGHPELLWPTRFVYVLAAVCAIALLIVDSPISTYLEIPISRAVAEAAPLLLVGIAYLAWLAIDRPAISDLITQVLIAAAFILWGVGLLMPKGGLATFVGAVVIAIYVFDLAWLMERTLRKKFHLQMYAGAVGQTSAGSKPAGVGLFNGRSGDPGGNHNVERRAETPIAPTNK